MPMTADASRLRQRIKQIRDAVEHLAPLKLHDVAQDAIAAVSQQALSDLAGREDQVGFDLAQFLRNISQSGPLVTEGSGRATIGILDTTRMGTLIDFDRILGIPELWHQGTGKGDTFRRFVFENEARRDKVALLRQAVWGDKTPQWYLLNYGYGGGDAYPAVPASHFIELSTRSDRMALLMRNAMASALRGIPRS